MKPVCLLILLLMGLSWSEAQAGSAPRAWFDSAHRGDLETLKKIHKKISVDAANGSGETALMLAAEADFKEIVGYLLSQNADVNLKDRTGNTALIYSLDVGADDVSNLLLAAGASTTVVDKDGNSILSVAAKAGREKIVTELIKKDPAALQGANADGETPVMAALRGAHFTLAEAMIKLGAKVDVKNKRGQGLLEVAKESGVPEGHTFYRALSENTAVPVSK